MRLPFALGFAYKLANELYITTQLRTCVSSLCRYDTCANNSPPNFLYYINLAIKKKYVQKLWEKIIKLIYTYVLNFYLYH